MNFVIVFVWLSSLGGGVQLVPAGWTSTQAECHRMVEAYQEFAFTKPEFADLQAIVCVKTK